MKTNVIQDTQRILDLIAKRDLDDDGRVPTVLLRLQRLINFSFVSLTLLEKKQLIEETVDNFNAYVNPGFLKYRKSFSPDYVAGTFVTSCFLAIRSSLSLSSGMGRQWLNVYLRQRDWIHRLSWWIRYL